MRLTPRSDPVDVGEELALGDPRVSHEEDVDVATDLHAVWRAVHAPHQEQQQCLLHILVAKDLGSQRARKLLVKIILYTKGGVYIPLQETSHFVLCREVVLSLKVKKYVQGIIGK